MTKKHHFTEHRLFSNELLVQLRQNLEQGKQSLIFHNRRGSANTTLCEQCGWSAVCPRCFIPFTLHADKFQLSCHICGNTARVPTSCPDCQSTDIIHKGIGTKLIESELKKLLPAASIARFDGDTANAETVESRYGELYDGTIDIIIGTQVIAKGLDLPRLNTVGVIQADAGLSMPDFGASERTFQLLAQVIGRVGRGEHKNNIIVQSYQPSAPAVQIGLKQDYREFYDITIKERRRAIFPPFTYLLKLTCVYKTEAATIRNSKKLATSLRIAYKDIAILGPTPAFYERQRDTYRWQIIIKSSRRSTLNAIANNLPPGWQYDIDPNTLL
jgi:primosomal protein N' (replication factor Y)